MFKKNKLKDSTLSQPPDGKHGPRNKDFAFFMLREG